MYDAYQNALRTIADSYEAEVALYGGRSLSRVATIVVSSGAFFQRLREGKPFLVHNLERLAAWFRDAGNWPNGDIPNDAAAALTSMGRPPIADVACDQCVKRSANVECDTGPIPHRGDRA